MTDDLEQDLILARLGDYPGSAGCKRIAAAYDAMREHDAPDVEWRSVKSPPSEGDWVLIAENTGTWMDVAMFRGGKWWQFNNSTHLREITDIVFAYWRPLPASPETNNAN